MSVDELLLALNDIQPPGEPPWWQMSIASISLIGVFLGGGLIALSWWRRRRAQYLIDLARRELQAIRARHLQGGNQRELVVALAFWLKRVALIAFPERGIEALSGERWLAFLDRGAGFDRFSSGHGRVFGGAHYREQFELETEELLPLCEAWLQAIRPRLLRRGRQA